MSKTTQAVVVGFGAVATSFVTAALLSFIELRYGHALYSFTFWFVIPIGAILSGFVAASGYYFSARLIHYRASRNLVAAVILTSIATFFLIYWLDFSFLRIDGRSVQGVISFSDFFTNAVSHTSLRFGTRGTSTETAVDLGAGGYLFALLQIVGFAIGGYLIYLILRALSYCEDCGRYLDFKGLQTRYYNSAEVLQIAFGNVLAEISGNRLQHAVLVQAATGSTESKGMTFSSAIDLKLCKGCGKHRITLRASRWSGKDWNIISGMNYYASAKEPVELEKDIAGFVRREI